MRRTVLSGLAPWVVVVFAAGCGGGGGDAAVGKGGAVGGVEAVEPKAPDLIEIAGMHVALAVASEEMSMLWGRIGGSDAERDSARLLAQQLAPWSDAAGVEAFTFETHRPQQWTVTLLEGNDLESAMPAPFDGRFPDGTATASLVSLVENESWDGAKGNWLYIEASTVGSAARNSVRQKLLYEKAVDAGAAGLLFSLPTPPGRWRTVAPIDKPFAKFDTRYPDGIRPIPCFSIDRDDGIIVRAALGLNPVLSASVAYLPDEPREGLNAVGSLKGGGVLQVGLMAHLDSFFTGANDDASGLAVLVGLAHELSLLPVEQRPGDFWFLGISGHHDSAAGMRAFMAEDFARASDLDQMILLEHLDAQLGIEGKDAGWPDPLNDRRNAYVGPDGWPEVEETLASLVRESGLMTVAPPVVKSCIADLFVVCGTMKTFTLIQGPPYYHTNHDTMDKLSAAGLRAAVEFHLGLLKAAGAIR